MKEIRKLETITKVIGYEASDGTVFSNADACEIYEKSAVAAAKFAFKKLLVGEEFPECSIFENFGYGSEEWMMGIVMIKDSNDLNILNQYLNIKGSEMVGPEYIGKKVIINIGSEYDRNPKPNPRTEEELIEEFKKDIHKYFEPDNEKKEDK